MCLLTYVPAGEQPNADYLWNGTINNNDGHGFAIVVPGEDRIIVHKGMGPAGMVEKFVAMRKLYPEGPALFHSRYATHGVVDEDNCHPFYVNHDERTVFAHNGIMPRSVQPKKGDLRSDTRITAEDFIPNFGNLAGRRNRKRFARWMTLSNKALLLTVDPRYSRFSYLFNEAMGSWDEGIWYSNWGYQPLTWRKEGTASTYYLPALKGARTVDRVASKGWLDNGWTQDDNGVWRQDISETWDDGRSLTQAGSLNDRCWNCHTHIPSRANACAECGWCAMCMGMPNDCDCDLADTHYGPSDAEIGAMVASDRETETVNRVAREVRALSDRPASLPDGRPTPGTDEWWDTIADMYPLK